MFWLKIEVTPQVLAILKENQIEATFFVVGDNVTKYPALYQQIIDEGHSIGNHTHNHIQGLKYNNKNYLDNVEQANRILKTNMFRPPHGSLKRAQYRSIIKKYKLIMWDVISCDYDRKLTPEQCFKNVVDFVRDGSIITFHDSIKAKKNVLEALPRVIEELKSKGFTFEKIEFPETYPLKVKKSQRQYNTVKESINKLLKGA